MGETAARSPSVGRQKCDRSPEPTWGATVRLPERFRAELRLRRPDASICIEDVGISSAAPAVEVRLYPARQAAPSLPREPRGTH